MMFAAPKQQPAAYPPQENKTDAAAAGQKQHGGKTPAPGPMLIQYQVRGHPQTPRSQTPGRGAFSPNATIVTEQSDPRLRRTAQSPNPQASPEGQMRRESSFSRLRPEEVPWELRQGRRAPEEQWELRAPSSGASEELPWELRPDNGFGHQDAGGQGKLHGRAPSARASSPSGWAPRPGNFFLAHGGATAMAPGDIQIPVFHASSPSWDPNRRPVSRSRGASPVHRVGPYLSAAPAGVGSPRPQMRQDSIGRSRPSVVIVHKEQIAPGQVPTGIAPPQTRYGEPAYFLPGDDPTKVRRIMATQSPSSAPADNRGVQKVMTVLANTIMRHNSAEELKPGMPPNVAPKGKGYHDMPMSMGKGKLQTKASVGVEHAASFVTQTAVPPDEEETPRDRGRGSRETSSEGSSSRKVSVPLDSLNVVRQELNNIVNSMASRQVVPVELFHRSMFDRLGKLEDQVVRLMDLQSDQAISFPAKLGAGDAAGGGEIDPAMASYMEQSRSGKAGILTGAAPANTKVAIQKGDAATAGTGPTLNIHSAPGAVETSSNTSTRLSNDKLSWQSLSDTAPTWAEVPSGSTMGAASNVDPQLHLQDSPEPSVVSDHPSETEVEMVVIKDGPHDRLGMDVRHLNGGLSIVSIAPGCALDRANREAALRNPPGPTLQVGDIIHQVNGITDADTDLVAECQEKLELNILAVRV